MGFLQGELPAAEREAIETHLDTCQSCFRLVGAVMRTGEPGALQSALDSGAQPEVQEETNGLPSTIADGRYVVRELLGQGGAGAVYRAYDSQLGRQIALKLVRAPKVAPNVAESMQARLLREARAMARVSHPNVVAVYDVGSIGDRVFLVMELVEGRTLAAWHREQSRSWREVIETFMAAGVGLHAAHRVGLVHRDFKPLNVLVGIDGRVRVTDFGLARPVAHADTGDATPSDSLTADHPEWTLTLTGGLVGTPRYMAPEQFKAGLADARSDQFSFCVALFTALYGRHPFFPEGTKKPPLHELAQLVMSGQLIPPVEASGIPAGIGDVLRRGLDADPGRRFPDMEVLISDLARQVGPVAPPTWWRRRAWLGVAGAAAAALAMVVVWFSSRPITRGDAAANVTATVIVAPPSSAVALLRDVNGLAGRGAGSTPAPSVAAVALSAEGDSSGTRSARESQPRRVRPPALPKASHSAKPNTAAATNPDRLKDPF